MHPFQKSRLRIQPALGVPIFRWLSDELGRQEFLQSQRIQKFVRHLVFTRRMNDNSLCHLLGCIRPTSKYTVILDVSCTSPYERNQTPCCVLRVGWLIFVLRLCASRPKATKNLQPTDFTFLSRLKTACCSPNWSLWSALNLVARFVFEHELRWGGMLIVIKTGCSKMAYEQWGSLLRWNLVFIKICFPLLFLIVFENLSLSLSYPKCFCFCFGFCFFASLQNVLVVWLNVCDTTETFWTRKTETETETETETQLLSFN